MKARSAASFPAGPNCMTWRLTPCRTPVKSSPSTVPHLRQLHLDKFMVEEMMTPMPNPWPVERR